MGTDYISKNGTKVLRVQQSFSGTYRVFAIPMDKAGSSAFISGARPSWAHDWNTEKHAQRELDRFAYKHRLEIYGGEKG